MVRTPATAMDVVGFGENSVDIVYRLPHHPQPGTSTSKIAIQSCEVRPGGQVATTLATCAEFGLGTRYVGSFGNDTNARVIREALQRRGVDLGHAVERDGPNRYAVILIDSSTGERTVLWQRDARLTISAGDVRRQWVDGARLLHVDAIDDEAAVALAHIARQSGLDVTSDIDDITSRTGALIDSVTIPILAEHVPLALTGERDTERALRALRQRHPGRLVVTLGARGAAMLDGDQYIQVAGCPVTVIDSTGAGDVFRGAFIYALLRGDEPEQILRFANGAAALSCTRAGALDSIPSLNAVQALMRPTA